MFTAITTIWEHIRENPEIRKRLLFSLLILLAFKAGSWVMLPGVIIFDTWSFGPFNSVGNIFSGGGFELASVMALALSPYVSAIIVVSWFRRKLFHDTPDPVRREAMIQRLTTILALAFSWLQSTAYLQYLKAVPGRVDPSLPESLWFVTGSLTLTAGTAFSIWLVHLNNKHGVGNGLTLLLDVGIALEFGKAVLNGLQAAKTPLFFVFELFFLMLAIWLILTIAQSKRALWYKKTPRSKKKAIHLRLNYIKFLPLGFASGLMFVPATLEQYLSGPNMDGTPLPFSDIYSWPYLVVFFVVIIAATVFQTAMSVDTRIFAQTIESEGGVLEGLKENESASEHIDALFFRMALLNGVLLALVGVLPLILVRFGAHPALGAFIGGFSLYNLVDSLLDVRRDLESAGVPVPEHLKEPGF